MKLRLSNIFILIGAIGSFGFKNPAKVSSFLQNQENSVISITATESNYYSDINFSATGNTLKGQLRELITSTHNTSANSYDALKSQFAKTDCNPKTGSNLLWFYTGTQVTSYSGSPSNREHVWPKDGGSAFPEKTGPGCDLQHLRPTDSSLNSTRGSLQFGEVEQTIANIAKENGSSSYGRSENGKDALCYKSGNYFYPAKGYRGATARILMYLEVRWGSQYNLKFVNGVGKTKTIGDFKTLMKWHLTEPVTEEEIYRNDAAYKIQGNRNPFIDHPEFASQIYGSDGESYNSVIQDVIKQYGDYEIPDVKNISLTPTYKEIGIGESATFNYTVSPSGASNGVKWSVSDDKIISVNNGVVIGKAAGTAKVICTSTENTSIYAESTVVVKEKEIVKPENITLNHSDLTLTLGVEWNLIHKITPENCDNKTVTWSSSAPEIVSVDNGKIKALQVGEANITVTTVLENKTATCKVKVIDGSKPSSNEESKEEKKQNGCGGNIISTSLILSILSIALLSFIIKKKLEK